MTRFPELPQYSELAECDGLTEWLPQLADSLSEFLRFAHPDAIKNQVQWQNQLDIPLPSEGVGIGEVVGELCRWVIPNGSQIPNPASSAFITTGATTAGVLAGLACSVASPQRIGLTAFHYLEELSLNWLAALFGLSGFKGIYSSGGSVANLLALGAARQQAYEQLGCDPALSGLNRPGRIYASAECHHSVQRAAAVLGLGRSSVIKIATDSQGRMRPQALLGRLLADQGNEAVPVAIVANAGSTNHGAIDPLRDIGQIARQFGLWFHVDGAYGLPGILDPSYSAMFDGLEMADSVVVDPHKWLGAPVGVGATLVRDRSLLYRAFTQEAADYLEGASFDQAHSSMASLGVPYFDYGVELSAPPRGAVVWALLREVGRQGIQTRVCRHNQMAKDIAALAERHPELELLMPPSLSICCFRYVSDAVEDLNGLNRQIHQRMLERGKAMPSTTMVNGKLAIRPCFVGARSHQQHAMELAEEVLVVGRHCVSQRTAG
ncbi:aminotransferase class V-fold PLP-dependent enzyme [Alteromonas aestuariivivens]|uniref:Aminotransferase class V-fold PLP-dependent enzyme n=1 Tax=Alteromonas aestuariivivens TaxID=1938339 RepID=A0A3D8MCT9_9ALTE|nr:aminotransferase class V-fold PLP-dependent enzyme [Alteromonas aestuariivivens]RDV28201.1 aminotransferase class V-fold PLP-dependent enzyme [Alteromonas aestuariivivens]